MKRTNAIFRMMSVTFMAVSACALSAQSGYYKKNEDAVKRIAETVANKYAKKDPAAAAPYKEVIGRAFEQYWSLQESEGVQADTLDVLKANIETCSAQKAICEASLKSLEKQYKDNRTEIVKLQKEVTVLQRQHDQVAADAAVRDSLALAAVKSEHATLSDSISKLATLVKERQEAIGLAETAIKQHRQTLADLGAASQQLDAQLASAQQTAQVIGQKNDELDGVRQQLVSAYELATTQRPTALDVDKLNAALTLYASNEALMQTLQPKMQKDLSAKMDGIRASLALRESVLAALQQMKAAQFDAAKNVTCVADLDVKMRACRLSGEQSQECQQVRNALNNQDRCRQAFIAFLDGFCEKTEFSCIPDAGSFEDLNKNHYYVDGMKQLRVGGSYYNVCYEALNAVVEKLYKALSVDKNYKDERFYDFEKFPLYLANLKKEF